MPVDRGIRCHVGCDIVFDADGNLYMSTGDDTNPFQSDGYTPIDERPESDGGHRVHRFDRDDVAERPRPRDRRPLSGVFVAEYSDVPPEGLPSLTGSDEVVLEPTG